MNGKKDRKKMKFVPLFKICKVNGPTSEEFHELIKIIEITLKNEKIHSTNYGNAK
jgi:hypothetical protein